MPDDDLSPAQAYAQRIFAHGTCRHAGREPGWIVTELTEDEDRYHDGTFRAWWRRRRERGHCCCWCRPHVPGP